MTTWYTTSPWQLYPTHNSSITQMEHDPVDEGTAVVIKELALENAGSEELEPGTIYAWVTAKDGKVQMVDLTDDKYLEYPKRKRGTVFVDDVPSFALYHAKHRINDQTEIWADTDTHRITAVLDAHSAAEARWQQHRLTLILKPSRQWEAWTGRDGDLMPQTDFAEFLQARIADIAAGKEISAARLLELAQNFTATTHVQFTSNAQIRDGQTQIQYIETIEATGGTKTGQFSLPHAFTLILKPFTSSPPREVTARLRFRLRNRALFLAYHLDDPEGIIRDAMDATVASVREATGSDVMHGIPS